ncbi:MAG: hydrogenase nickel incorporation protein HypA [Candidatus Brockarchaeota archaeon]|nr:hydrogenase nickel incorporation protein HypA [Candidatus Brockarchaeota archaeon]MBO3842520.1 hydrogenase nickel incorporation protein HypA [Candidatus Brockarchaeota archaeon]
MHEWALAEAVVKTILRMVEGKGIEKIIEVKIKVGEMQQVENDIFRTALEQLKPVELKDTKFIIEVAKTELKCRVCGFKWFFQRDELGEDMLEAIHFLPEVSHAYVKCPECGSPDFEIVGGRGVWIESIKGLEKNG